MLTFERSIPVGVGDGSPVLVLLHGRGSNERDLIALAPMLPPDLPVVTPRAPFPGAPWGYGDGWAWYRFLGGVTPDPAPFEQSLEEIDRFLSALPGALEFQPGQLLIGGFSQGGTMALGYALTHRAQISAVVMMSGFLPSHPAVDVNSENVAELPIFWGHGTEDPTIPHANGVAGRAALKAGGALVTARDYPIGHTISPNEVRDLRQWLDSLTTGVPAKTGEATR